MRRLFHQGRNPFKSQDGRTDLHAMKVSKQDKALGSFTRNIHLVAELVLEEEKIAISYCPDDIHLEPNSIDLALLMVLDS